MRVAVGSNPTTLIGEAEGRRMKAESDETHASIRFCPLPSALCLGSVHRRAFEPRAAADRGDEQVQRRVLRVAALFGDVFGGLFGRADLYELRLMVVVV